MKGTLLYYILYLAVHYTCIVSMRFRSISTLLGESHSLVAHQLGALLFAATRQEDGGVHKGGPHGVGRRVQERALRGRGYRHPGRMRRRQHAPSVGGPSHDRAAALKVRFRNGLVHDYPDGQIRVALR